MPKTEDTPEVKVVIAPKTRRLTDSRLFIVACIAVVGLILVITVMSLLSYNSSRKADSAAKTTPAVVSQPTSDPGPDYQAPPTAPAPEHTSIIISAN